jgi:hypothetical protein
MTEKDKNRFAMCLMACGEMFSKPLSKPAMTLWFDALGGYDITAIEAAFKAHLSNPDIGQFMPKPADIIRAISGSNVDTALIAWSRVTRAIESVGAYQSVVFDDGIIHAVISDMGGWIALCSCTNAELPFKANEFEKRYRGYKSRTSLPAFPNRLIGIAELENTPHGFDNAPPVLIGNLQNAHTILTNGKTLPLDKPIGLFFPAVQPKQELTHENP